jgi:hypothetical protein
LSPIPSALNAAPKVYTWPGAEYSGEVSSGKRHGRGTMRFADGEAVYEGGWAGGMRHGRGTLWFDAARTAYYEGAWSVVKQSSTYVFGWSVSHMHIWILAGAQHDQHTQTGRRVGR